MNAIMWQPGVTLDQVERQVIERAFHYFNQNKAKTASALGISIRTLDTRLEDYATRNPGTTDRNGPSGNAETRRSDETARATQSAQPDSSDQSARRPTEHTQDSGARLANKQSAVVPEKQQMPVRKRN